ncbi:MAG: aminomethyl-transferring glycine dehydrogenase subunit GcvPA, partial [Muribaculaceae bacterium]|nr:aminomethyl-transferring glycine dehydrogenase subunit GcvPA [Muribaculaceae bacterium]
PAVVSSILSRSEFLTAYTPYQPEISQGTLQYIFEYQSMMCELTGMDISNASMYDGATATAEAMIMAVNSARKKRRVLISATVNPAVAEVVSTYARYHGITLEVIPENEGISDRYEFEAMLGAGDVAGVIVAYPNYYGIVEPLEGWADACHAAKALFIVNCQASTLGVLRSPASLGADIVCGDAQSLGMPLNFGGPYLGFLCTTKALMRKLPGRIVGATTDRSGQRVFVLTLQAREQHIRREKATSNICSNQGLMALHTAVYLSLMGAEGLRRVNDLGYGGIRSLAAKLEATGRMRLKYPEMPFVNEAVFRTADPLTADRVIEECAAQGILAGVKIDESELLVAVTEMQSPEDIDRYVSIVKNIQL